MLFEVVDFSSLLNPATAFAGVLAYFGGTLTKPITTLIENRVKRHQIRNSLYAELAGNYTTLAHLRNYLNGPDLSGYNVEYLAKQDIRFEAYDSAMKTPELFYSLAEANSLRNLCSSFREIVDPPQADARVLKVLISTALETLKMSIKFKYINEQRLLKTAAQSVALIIHEKQGQEW